MTETKIRYAEKANVPEHFVRGDTFLDAFPNFSGIVVEFDPKRELYQMFSTNISKIEKDKYYLLVVERSNYEKEKYMDTE